MSVTARVALSQDFLTKLAKLPAAVQGNVAKWVLKFQQDPTSTGINYEAIRTARDKNLKSVRIDQNYRGIVFRPQSGDLFILLHVDKHDGAYRWAEGRKLAVNPVTGAIQVVNLEAADEVIAAPGHAAGRSYESVTPDPVVVTGLFAGFSDDQLMQVGTPSDLIPLVRSMTVESDLDAAQEVLPVEAYEGLFLLAAGETVTQVLVGREARVDRPIDTEDFGAALDVPESQSRFVVVTSDEALQSILNAPLQQWRVYLHPTQRRLAEGPRGGPVRVLGGAGTGKTVLAMHRAVWLARNHATAERKVLFTTFTRNLALDIAQNIKSLMGDDPAHGRIEVSNLDKWVFGYLRKQNYPHQIVYGLQKKLWETAMALAPAELGFDETFFAEEWSQIITAQGIETLDDYRRATRTGRRTVLTRSKRDQVWPVFEEYRLQLSSQRLKDADDAFRDAAALLSTTMEKPFSAIVIDETQDFGPQALKLLRAMVSAGPNDLFFVGDGHQRIYKRHLATMSRCGINIQGRSRKLYLNYRTTEEIRRAAVALLEGREIDDLDGGSDNNQRYKSLTHGPEPEVVQVDSPDAGVQEAVGRVTTWLKEPEAAGHTICVMAVSKVLRDAVGAGLEATGVPVSVINADSADTTSSDSVRVATMHRAKGLEFDRVVVLTPQGIEPVPGTDIDQLIYVSLTRAKTAAVLLR